MSIRLCVLFVLSFLLSNLWAEDLVNQSLLPPLLEWHGKSESFVRSPNDTWATMAEKTDFADSPNYMDTIAYLDKLMASTALIQKTSLGLSPQGRDIWMYIVTQDPSTNPKDLKSSGKMLFLAQAGIHSGEIDGKDAGMMLIRDLVQKNEHHRLLEKVAFLFVPIFSVDAHEVQSEYARINQRGPRKMGWRTNSKNLNLNRDYAMAQSSEMQAMIQALRNYEPHLYFDIHVTDGADYQYDITYGSNGVFAYSPAENKWLNQRLYPLLDKELIRYGHVPGPLIQDFEEDTFEKGMYNWTATPRYSTGYGDSVHIPTVLIENHSLKSYKQRVLGTYVLLQKALYALKEESRHLKRAIATDLNRRDRTIALGWKKQEKPSRQIAFKAIRREKRHSDYTGKDYDQWVGVPYVKTIPIYDFSVPTIQANVPQGYVIPVQWKEVIDVLRLHGIQMSTFDQAQDKEVVELRIVNATLASKPYEGRVRVGLDGVKLVKAKKKFPAGSVYVSTDQPRRNLIVMLLEPESEESFYQWGYMLHTLQKTEYAEDYAIEPWIDRMMKSDAKLQREYAAEKAAHPDKKPQEWSDWFYSKSPFADPNWNIYPIARVP